MQEDERVKFYLDRNQAELIVSNATIKDAGAYTCTLKNDLGQERVQIKVIVIDKPSQPQGPLEASDIKEDGCKLTWKPPKVCLGFSLNKLRLFIYIYFFLWKMEVLQ